MRPVMAIWMQAQSYTENNSSFSDKSSDHVCEDPVMIIKGVNTLAQYNVSHVYSARTRFDSRVRNLLATLHKAFRGFLQPSQVQVRLLPIS
jgi:hypothetical protein